MNKPRIAIVGLGRYYRKLEQAILDHFVPVLKADKAEVKAAGGDLRTLVLRATPDAVMLLTPNQLHAKHLLELADLRLPILVEKPLVTSKRDLERVLDSLSTNPQLYCSDFYLDVRSAPLLAWLGRVYPACLRRFITIEHDKGHLWGQGLASIGPILRVEAALLEGEGEAASFDGREWLWDTVHGGVLWDLAYHHIALWHGSFGEPLSLISVDARNTQDDRGQRGAEIFAALELKAASGIGFSVKVGKYFGGTNERNFRIEGSRGHAEMRFQNPNVLELRRDAQRGTILLAGNYYAHVVEAFREFVDAGRAEPHGLDAAVAATRLIAHAKQLVSETPLLAR